ncbi:hypothetical protein TNCV_57651 [Trichonephila clavipes]|nr:hypothetical protein TNCV_57651 [Trichonephila clavipes]
MNWPPRSCDLTPLDYFLWDYVKSLVYADKPQTLDHLEDNIRRVIADIRTHMLGKVIENWTSRLDYIRASVPTRRIEERKRNFPIEIIFVNLPTAVTTRSQGKHFQNMVKRGCRWVILEVKGVDQKVREQVQGNGKCGLEFTRRCPTHLDGLGPQKAKRKEAETSFTSYYD